MAVFRWGNCPKCGERRRIVAETKPPIQVTVSFECGHVSVIEPEGSEVTVVILAGQTFRGVTYYEETRFDVSPEYAKHLVSSGIARCAS